MAKEKKPQYLLPAGEAVWPWINKYDDRPIKGKPQTPSYKLPVRYAANNPAWLEAKKIIDRLVDESYEEAIEKNPKKKKIIVKQYPYSMDTDDEGEETGYVTVKLKQNAFIKDKKTGKEILLHIPKFTASGAPLKNSLEMVQDEDTGDVTGSRGKVVVYGGSIVKPAFTTRPYLVDSTNGAGVSMDLKAVQILQLISAQERSATSYGFTAEAGYESDDEEDEDETASTEASVDESDEADATAF